MPSRKMDMSRIEDKSLNELIDSYLSDEGVEIFDNVVDAAKRKSSRVRTLSWSAAGLVAAASIGLVQKNRQKGLFFSAQMDYNAQ